MHLGIHRDSKSRSGHTNPGRFARGSFRPGSFRPCFRGGSIRPY